MLTHVSCVEWLALGCVSQLSRDWLCSLGLVVGGLGTRVHGSVAGSGCGGVALTPDNLRGRVRQIVDRLHCFGSGDDVDRGVMGKSASWLMRLGVVVCGGVWEDQEIRRSKDQKIRGSNGRINSTVTVVIPTRHGEERLGISRPLRC